MDKDLVSLESSPTVGSRDSAFFVASRLDAMAALSRLEATLAAGGAEASWLATLGGQQLLSFSIKKIRLN